LVQGPSPAHIPHKISPRSRRRGTGTSGSRSSSYPTAAPVRRTITDTEAEIVGILLRLFRGDLYLSRPLPQGIDGVFVVLENTCGQAVTYEINGSASYLGTGDLHQLRYNYLESSRTECQMSHSPKPKPTSSSYVESRSDEYDAPLWLQQCLTPVITPFQNTINMRSVSQIPYNSSGQKRSQVSLLPCSFG
jgi:hypothetical protein